MVSLLAVTDIAKVLVLDRALYRCGGDVPVHANICVGKGQGPVHGHVQWQGRAHVTGPRFAHVQWQGQGHRAPLARGHLLIRTGPCPARQKWHPIVKIFAIVRCGWAVTGHRAMSPVRRLWQEQVDTMGGYAPPYQNAEAEGRAGAKSSQNFWYFLYYFLMILKSF